MRSGLSTKFFFLAVALTAVSFLSAQEAPKAAAKQERGKTLQLGAATWFTEQNDFAEIVRMARKLKKPILGFFTAEWCGPCQGVKKAVLSGEDFGQVAREAVLFYIEETDPKGKEYVARHGIKAFPTFLLFDSAGKQYGIGRIRPTLGALLKAVRLGKSGLLAAKAKTIKIGTETWFTGETPFAEALQAAQKSGKIVLVYLTMRDFSDENYVSPEEKLMTDPAFKGVSELAVLYFLDAGSYPDRQFWADSSSFYYPCFKIFAADGQLLEPKARPFRTVSDMVTLVSEVREGKSYDGLKRQLEADPGNRELLERWIEKIPFERYRETIAALKKLIDLKPDVKDALTQKAYERLVYELLLEIHSDGQDEKERREIAIENRSYFDTLMKSYYPDRFIERMKGIAGVFTIVSWYNELGEFSAARSCFEAYRDSPGSEWRENRPPFHFTEVIWAYLKSGEEKKAAEWLARFQELAAKEQNTRDAGFLAMQLGRFNETFARFYAEKGDRAIAREYLQKIFLFNTQQKREQENESLKGRFAYEYGVFAEEFIAQDLEELKTATGKNIWRIQLDLARLHAAKGEAEVARRIILEALADKRILEAFPEAEKPGFLAAAARALVQAKVADEKTLDLAREAVRLKEELMTLDALAEAYAALGRWKDAAEWGEKAFRAAPSGPVAELFRRKAERWKKKSE